MFLVAEGFRIEYEFGPCQVVFFRGIKDSNLKNEELNPAPVNAFRTGRSNTSHSEALI